MESNSTQYDFEWTRQFHSKKVKDEKRNKMRSDDKSGTPIANYYQEIIWFKSSYKIQKNHMEFWSSV